MGVQFINKINKESNSLTTLKIEDEEFPLTEKDLTQLVRALYDARQDVFNEAGLIYENEAEVQELKDRVEELQDENRRLEEENASLENELSGYEEN